MYQSSGSLLISVEKSLEVKSSLLNPRRCLLSSRDLLIISEDLRYTLLDIEGSFVRTVMEGDLFSTLGAATGFTKGNLHWLDLVADSTIVTLDPTARELVLFDLTLGQATKKLQGALSALPQKYELHVNYDKRYKVVYVLVYDTEKHGVEVNLTELRSGQSRQVYKGNIFNLNVVRLSQGCLFLGNQSGQKNPLEITCLQHDKQLLISGQFKDKDIILNYGYLDQENTCLFMLFNKKKGKKSGIYLADVPLAQLTEKANSASLKLAASTKGLQRVILFAQQKEEQDILLGEAVFDAKRGLAVIQGWLYTHLFRYHKTSDNQWIFTPLQRIAYNVMVESSVESKSGDMLALFSQQAHPSPKELVPCPVLRTIHVADCKPLYLWLMVEAGLGKHFNIGVLAELVATFDN